MDNREAAAVALCEVTENIMVRAMRHPDVGASVVMTALCANAVVFSARFGGTREKLLEMIRDMPLCPEEEAANSAVDELNAIVMAFGGGDPERDNDGNVIRFPNA